MAQLINTFSWSFSAAADFDECRRRRFWSKYEMWGGWAKSASAQSQKAYLLNKMDNRFSIMGKAVEDSIMWILRQHQSGNEVSAEQAYEQIARPYLLQSWKDSQNKFWQQNAKQFCNLREHYYEKFADKTEEKEAVTKIREQVERCIKNFTEKTLPRLKDIAPSQEILIGASGDPENFLFEGIKIYAIPDYVYRIGEQLFIIDWKAGKIKESHMKQVALYGLWANIKYHIPPENVTVAVEYLECGERIEARLTQNDLNDVKNRISESVGEMTEYLVDFDRKRNAAIPQEEWELADDPCICEFCNFYELCKAELEESANSLF